jgi:hypothetical protein
VVAWIVTPSSGTNNSPQTAIRVPPSFVIKHQAPGAVPHGKAHRPPIAWYNAAYAVAASMRPWARRS